MTTKFEWNTINIKGRTSGQIKTTCPVCSPNRKNKHDACLSVNIAKGVANCHHCGAVSFREDQKTLEQPMPYKKPSKKNITKLNKAGLEYFEKRGITQEVLNSNKICSTKTGDGVFYPYFMDKEFVNYKIRYFQKKDFRQAVGAKPIMFNYDRIKSAKEIIVCEGEEDSMSWEVAGFEYHTSVNQGAPNEKDKSIDAKLECVTNCFDAFEQAETIYIATDNDANGRRLRDELVRRFKPEKCKLVNFGSYKDANEVLYTEGPEKLKSLLSEASDPLIEGIITLDMVWDSMLDGFINGKEYGTTTHFPPLDEYWTWKKSEVNVWTGYENEGKSTFLKQLCLVKSAKDGVKHAFFTPEDMPIGDFFDDLIEMYVGKSCDKRFPHLLMSKEEYKRASEFVKKHFFVIYPGNNFKLETIFDKAKYLIRKHGIFSLIIDPYNTVEHLQKGNEREELYISRFMASLKKIAVDHHISVNLVAHQNTARKNQDGKYQKPWKDNIKGGGTFSQKADNVLLISRPDFATDKKSNIVLFQSGKIKKQKLVGTPGEYEMTYQRQYNRYYCEGKNPLNAPDKNIPVEERPLPNMTPTDAFGDEVNLDEIPF